VPATYEPIATQTLGSAASSITFSSIGSGYTDLRVVLVGTVATAGGVAIRFNSDSGSNYSRTVLFGDGSTAASARSSNQTQFVIANINSANPSLITCDIFSYAGSTFKTALGEGSDDRNGSGVVARGVGLWRNTAAITTITLIEANAANFSTGTTATLYGIKNA
jgi:hypothetical protein